MKLQYNTKQKSILLECLESQKSQSLTVDGVCEALENAGEKIGRSTVYRRLEELCREGKVRRFAPEAGKSVTYRFIGSGCDSTCNFHLVCSKCGEIYHTHCPKMSGIFEHIASSHDFEVDKNKTVLYGICKKCRGGEN